MYCRVWNTSRVKAVIEAQAEFTVAGDSAYPISRWLIKPFQGGDCIMVARSNISPRHPVARFYLVIVF